MPKAGKFNYPGIDITDAVGRIRKIYDVTKKLANPRAIAAQAMGFTTEKSGQALLVIASLDKYGIAETGGNELKVTELGQKILFAPTDTEREMGMKEAVIHVELFRNIVKTYGINPTDQQLNIFLQQTAMVDLPKLAATAEDVRRMLKKNEKYLMSIESPQTPPSSGSQEFDRGERMQEISVKASGVVEIRPEQGKPYSFPLDNIRLVRLIINEFLDDLEKQRKQTEPKGE